MIVEGVIILHAGAPASPRMLALQAKLKAAGIEVFLKPHSHLEHKKKVPVTPALQTSLGGVNPN